jgi:uncharacterized membrane protein
MLKRLLLLAFVFTSLFAAPVLAQEAPLFEDDLPPPPMSIENTYTRGTVKEILEDTVLEIEGYRQPYQRVSVEISEGDDRGTTFVHDFQLPVRHTDSEKLRVGETVVVVKIARDAEVEYYVAEKYRLPSVIWIFLGFFLLAVLFGGWKGFTSVLGLGVSLTIIVTFIIPQIVAGRSPVWVSIIGGVAILLCSLYLAHGFNKRTSVALVGTMITLFLAAGLSMLVVSFAKLFGMGSEESYTLMQGQLQNINLRGLYLGGIIIGALGVLDDITTAQSATVNEIHRANPSLSAAELYKRGNSVGSEHIASLINTLALAYVGASLPTLLIFTQTDFPLWIIFNSEFLVEEIMRTLVGSITLILAVPITTGLAAIVFGREQVTPGDHEHDHDHHHHGHSH